MPPDLFDGVMLMCKRIFVRSTSGNSRRNLGRLFSTCSTTGKNLAVRSKVTPILHLDRHCHVSRIVQSNQQLFLVQTAYGHCGWCLPSPV
jgi:hypothetical protein